MGAHVENVQNASLGTRKGMTDLELYFQYRCEQGLAKRSLDKDPKYKEQLTYEIGIITKMGYVGYFLIVSDILTWAVSRGIPTGPGRGSVAGSLVAYVLEITHLDPIKYGLIFERFINPARVSMPDIDMDFCELRRNEVIEYVEEKYGRDKVAHIGTFGSMKAKGSIRSVARVLGYDYLEGDKLARLTLEPIEGKPQPLKTCYEKVEKLATLRNTEGPTSHILSFAERVEDRLRTFGTHASGVVIAPTPITEIMPLYPGKDGTPTTQFEMYTVEECGLIKFDFLGLRALTTIRRCTDLIKERHGIEIDPLKIPVDDGATYKMLQSGSADGIFQIEGSSGIRDLMIQIKPERLEDLSTLTAVYRPGPLGSDMLDHYLQVRAGKAEPKYTTPELESILGESGGMLIYQEQILEICKQLAGYSMAEADMMRRAVGKKKQDLMDKEEVKFKEGIKQNLSQKVADKLWHDINVFAGYGFNKAHAACYAYIGYQMAWLKCHYPLELMCSCLISDSDEADKVTRYINHCNDIGIQVLPPSVNHSSDSFSIDGDNIRFGLVAIKNLGKPAKDIIKEREENGPFKDILDFASRVDLSKINKRKLESLVLAGAFDALGEHSRSSLLGAVEDILRYKDEKKRYDSKLKTYVERVERYAERTLQLNFWDSLSKAEKRERTQRGEKKPGKLKLPIEPEVPAPPHIPSLPPLPEMERLAHEKELIGHYISGHPLDLVKGFESSATISDIKERGIHRERVSLVTLPSMIKEITTKKNKQKMAYLVLEDKTGTIEAVILSPSYSKHKALIATTLPAIYKAEVEVVSSDEHKTRKVRVLSVRAIPNITPTDTVGSASLPISAALELAKKMQPDESQKEKVQLFCLSDSDSHTWGMPAKGYTLGLEEIKEFIKESI
jgi:DNA polymerase-3 subunit alpha